MTTPFPSLSERGARRTPSPIRELMPYMREPGMISLGGGYPNPDTFPFQGMQVDLVGRDEPVALNAQELSAAMQYAQTPGVPMLLDRLTSWHEFKGGPSLPTEQFLVLTGSQEGLFIAADVLLDPSDEIVISEPSYPGALSAFRSATARLTTIPVDSEGLQVDLLEELLQKRRGSGAPYPKVVYTIPNGHNPAGVSLSEKRRHRLAALAEEYELFLFEDDPYELLALDESPRPPSLQSLVPERVLRFDSFSKILCPGLRLGYASGPAHVIRAMALHKQASSLHTSSFAQALLHAFLRVEGNDGLMLRIRTNVPLYRRNRDAMLEASRRFLPEGVNWRTPTSGMFVWYTLPEGFDAARMVREDCSDLKVLLVPGSAFSPTGGLNNAMRASYSMVSIADAVEGMRRFGAMIERERLRLS